MISLQAWFAPLLWIIGTITALAAFVRLCKPLWNFFKIPNELSAKFTKFDQKIENMNNSLIEQKNELLSLREQNSRQDEVTLSLLHDQIVQIYENAKREGTISEVSYYRACELYKQNGNSEYIDNIMKSLSDLHNKNFINEDL